MPHLHPSHQHSFQDEWRIIDDQIREFERAHNLSASKHVPQAESHSFTNDYLLPSEIHTSAATEGLIGHAEQFTAGLIGAKMGTEERRSSDRESPEFNI